jgi:hypothetical protein
MFGGWEPLDRNKRHFTGVFFKISRNKAVNEGVTGRNKGTKRRRCKVGAEGAHGEDNGGNDVSGLYGTAPDRGQSPRWRAEPGCSRRWLFTRLHFCAGGSSYGTQ